MLTIRKIKIASGDLAAARRTADYVLDVADSPGVVGRALDAAHGHAAVSGVLARPTTVWLGSAGMLARLGVREGAAVAPSELALALQGRHTRSGERVRVEGLIQRDAVDERGRPLHDEQGRRRTVRVPGTKSVDLTFSAPKPVSVVWSQAGPRLRAEIESAMLAAANAMLENMTQTRPVVAHRGTLLPARGFAAAAALHVMARATRGETVPSPQLHVHGIVLGVERADGFFASPEPSGMFKHGAPLEGGAVARLRLAETLVELGFDVVPAGRFFELRGVPPALLQRMSGRTRDVEARIGERERAMGRPLNGVERSLAALETRAPKSREAPLKETVAAWRASARELGFGPAAVEALRIGPGFAAGVDERRAAAVAAASASSAASSAAPWAGARRAVLFERAAGRLRLREAYATLDALPDAA